MRESVPGACTPFPCPSQTVTIGSLNVIHVLTFKLKDHYRDKQLVISWLLSTHKVFLKCQAILDDIIDYNNNSTSMDG